MYCPECKKDVETAIADDIYVVCTICGRVLENNPFGYSNQGQDGSDDPDDKVGGTGDYGDQQNPGEDPAWIKD